MKTHHIKDLLKKELLILELPKVCDYKLTKEMIFIMDKERSTIHRFKGSYTLLGKPDEIKEEDAMELVHKVEGYNPVLKEFHKAYRLYTGRVIRATHTATESLLSAIDSVIFWDGNPLGSKHDVELIASRKSEVSGKHLLSLRHEAELRTFDRSRTLIFVKN